MIIDLSHLFLTTVLVGVITFMVAFIIFPLFGCYIYSKIVSKCKKKRNADTEGRRYREETNYHSISKREANVDSRRYSARPKIKGLR